MGILKVTFGGQGIWHIGRVPKRVRHQFQTQLCHEVSERILRQLRHQLIQLENRCRKLNGCVNLLQLSDTSERHDRCAHGLLIRPLLALQAFGK
jgi:hypothetical protein